MNKVSNRSEKIKNFHLKDNLSLFGSKVEIVRNFINFPFVNKLTLQYKELFEEQIIEFIKKKIKNVKINKIEDLSSNEINFLKDISVIDDKISKTNIIAFIDENTFLLVNHIDHIRIVTASLTENISVLYKKAMDMERKLSNFSDYSINAKYGYLSPSLNNCGLGLFLSSFLNIPSILKTYSFENLMSLLEERGYYLFLHNFNNVEKNNVIMTSKLNYGITEFELFESYNKGIEELIKLEMSLSKIAFKTSEIDDRIFRSFGILKYAKKLNRFEMIDILQNLRLGLKLNLGIPLTAKNLNLIQLITVNTDIEKESLAAKIDKDSIIPTMIKPFLEENNVQ